MNIFTQFFKNKQTNEEVSQNYERDLMRAEAQLAQNIFGPVQNGGKREFFCLDRNTWIWYEQWTSDAGEAKQITTRYLVRSGEIVKSQNGGAYHRLTIAEAENFQAATQEYLKKAKAGLYSKIIPAEA